MYRLRLDKHKWGKSEKLILPIADCTFISHCPSAGSWPVWLPSWQCRHLHIKQGSSTSRAPSAADVGPALKVRRASFTESVLSLMSGLFYGSRLALLVTGNDYPLLPCRGVTIVFTARLQSLTCSAEQTYLLTCKTSRYCHSVFHSGAVIAASDWPFKKLRKPWNQQLIYREMWAAEKGAHN